MNTLIPIDQNDISLPVDELGIARLSFSNNSIFIFIIPICLFFFFRNSNTLQEISSKTDERPKGPTIDSNSLDKMSHLLENVKKATTLNDLRKNISQSGGLGNRNIHFVKELLNVFSDNINENSKSSIQNISTVLSLLEKGKDIKNILNIKKAVQSGDGDLSAQINNIIDAVAPILPAKYVTKVNDFKKMAQMVKLMSLFDGDEGDDEDNSDHEHDRAEPVSTTHTFNEIDPNDISPVE
ncbi:hypothetical protein [Marinisporobacter balticus]|uniref:Uncharacterized protein n=1 Tax=Marinisporobacter balticus TaxID=2018667 RepID=A0A4R2KUF3_9FIRM|nr:hypothetical protein [Marinisporobacter balticus]TCO73818.1 hypothetical protein EV214_11453 [Marinisporobacter balticus]